MSSSAAGASSPKLWGGRFTGATDPAMEAFNNSIHFDKRMWRADIDGSIAYARALAAAKLLTAAEAEELVRGLTLVAGEWAAGTFAIAPGDEDIHTANERRLGEHIGALAGKLHTGRSRNDQVATDVRLWLKGELRGLRGHLLRLIGVAAARAPKSASLNSGTLSSILVSCRKGKVAATLVGKRSCPMSWLSAA